MQFRAVVRWVALIPVAYGLQVGIMRLSRPVGGFLGGWLPFWPWAYKLAYLCFTFTADAALLIAAMAIAPRGQRVVGLIVGGIEVANALIQALLSQNDIWSYWARVYWVVSVCMGVAAGYLLAWYVIEQLRADAA